MRKFKHVETGNIATETHSEKNYKVSYPQNYTIPKWIIENSKDWVEIFEPKFKNGDIVKHNNSAMVLITDFENQDGYGFDFYKNWVINKWNFNTTPQDWQLATQEEWLEALTKEAVKNGLIKDNYALFGTSKHKRKIELTEYRLNEEGYLCNGINILMKNGIWADVVKEETLDELAERFHEFYTNSLGGIKDCYITFFTKNKETIHRLSR